AGAQPQKTLVIAIGADQTGLDPQTVQNNESGFVMSTMFDSVVNYKPGSSEVGPGRAESGTVSAEGKVFTFKLRRGVKFDDGTGPFKFVEAVRNDHITLDANPDYWGGRPKVDRIIFKIVPESATRMLMLERNEVQILADVPPSDYARVQNNKALQLYKQPGLT